MGRAKSFPRAPGIGRELEAVPRFLLEKAKHELARVRGHVVAQGCGSRATLQCPYHAWTYELDGSLRRAPRSDREAGFDAAGLSLYSVSVDAWGPFVFVNQDPGAASLSDVLGTIPQEAAEIGCRTDRLRFSYRRDYVIACNWKVYIDNYLEGYHLPAAHPSLFRELDYAQYRVETFRYYSSQIAPIRKQSGDGARRYEFADSNNRALYYWIFPNFMLNVYPDNFSTNLIVPVGQDRTLTAFAWYFRDPEASKKEIEETIAFSDEIQLEDIAICEAVQRGLRSSTYDTGRYSPVRENGLHHFHGLYAAAMGL